jgi:hypothetical protein
VTHRKPLSIEIHAALELGLAAALIMLPYAVGLSPAPVMVGIGIGALLAGLAITGSDPGSRGGLPLSAHAAYDWAVATALLGAGIVLGLASGPAALILFVAAGLAEFTLAASTSYSARRA